MNKRYINVKDIQRGVADTYLGVNGNGAVLSPNNSDEIDSAIAALNNQIDSIHDTLNSDYYVNIAPNYTFESNTTVSKNITGAYYNKIKEAVADNKMVMAAIVDGAVKTFNLVEQGRYNLRFASYIIDANGVLNDYIVLTEVQDGFPPENVTVGYRLTYQSEYSTYPTADLTGYATEQWVEDKGYLTSVPSEYVTETELNDTIANLEVGGIPYIVVNGSSSITGDFSAVHNAVYNKTPYVIFVGTNLFGYHTQLNQCVAYNDGRIVGFSNLFVVNSTTTQLTNRQWTIRADSASYEDYVKELVDGENLKTINGESILGSGDITINGGTDIPTVVISNGDANSTTPRVTSGDLYAVINAISTNSPYIAYFVNVGTKYGVSGKKYLIQAADFNAANNTGALYYHTEIDGGNHMDVQIFFRKENDVYTVFNITRQYHYYQEQLTSGVNIKTINGNSILGSGDLVIEGGGTTDLTGYATEQWVEDKGYATTTYVDTQIGNINTILENIIG